jgi:hypothetical protein
MQKKRIKYLERLQFKRDRQIIHKKRNSTQKKEAERPT